METERLVIRPFVMDDLDAIHHILDVDLKMGDFTRERRARWLQWSSMNAEELAAMYQPPYGEQAVVLKATNELVGVVGIVPSMMPFGLLPYYSKSGVEEKRHFPEVGLYWSIATPHQRKGYAREAAQRVIDMLFNDLNIVRVIATTEYDNLASQAVMRSLGMDIQKNPYPDPFYMQVVGILDNPKT